MNFCTTLITLNIDLLVLLATLVISVIITQYSEVFTYSKQVKILADC